MTFNYNGNLLVSGSTDKTARIWDVETGQCLQVLTGHTAPVYPTVFSNDGLIFATRGEDGLIYLWNVNSGTCVRTMRVQLPYENMDITGIRGITDAQISSLKVLGAVEM